MSNGKVMIKKTQHNSIDCIKMSQYFPKPYETFGGDIKSNLKSHLASLKTEVDK